MPQTYYEKIIALLNNLVVDEGISVPEILKIIEHGENNAGINRTWLYDVYNEAYTDPGIKKMDALYRVLRKKKQQLQKAAK